MFPQDLPQKTAELAAAILGCRFHSAPDGRSTRTDRTVRPSKRQRAHLKHLQLAVSPPDQGDQELVHVWETYQDRLPERQSKTSGPWAIQHKTIVEDKPLLYYNQLRPGLHSRYMNPAPVTVLVRTEPDGSEVVWMSNSALELSTMSDSLEECRGHVLVAGLGLGLFPVLAAQKREVRSVTVIENDPAIIELNADYVAGPKVQVVEGDAWNPKPEELAKHPFDYCFFDIWPKIEDAFQDEMAARAAVYPVMQRRGRVSVWCQKLNDRKRESLIRIGRYGPAAATLSEPGATCYQCADDTTSDLDGLCPRCAYIAWREHPGTDGIPFPVPPEELPEYHFITEAQRILDNLPPDLLEVIRGMNELERVIA